MADEKKDEPPKQAPEVPKEVEIKTTFIEVFGDRFKSHTLGGFVLAWVAVHWKAVFATFFVPMEDLPGYDADNQPILNKIDYFISLKYDNCDHYVWPLLIALAVPLVAAFFDEVVIKLVKQLITRLGRWARKAFATETLYSSDEYRELERQKDEAKTKYELEKKSRESADDQLENLRGRLKQSNEAHGRREEGLENHLRELASQLASATDGAKNLQNDVNRLTKDNTDIHADRENIRLELAKEHEKRRVLEQELKANQEYTQRRKALEALTSRVNPVKAALIQMNQQHQGRPLTGAIELLTELEDIQTRLFSYHESGRM